MKLYIRLNENINIPNFRKKHDLYIFNNVAIVGKSKGPKFMIPTKYTVVTYCAIHVYVWLCY